MKERFACSSGGAALESPQSFSGCATSPACHSGASKARKKASRLAPFHKKPNCKDDHNHNDYDLNSGLNGHFAISSCRRPNCPPIPTAANRSKHRPKNPVTVRLIRGLSTTRSSGLSTVCGYFDSFVATSAAQFPY